MKLLDKWAATANESARGIVRNKLQGFTRPNSVNSGSTDPNLNNRNYAVIIKQNQGSSALVVVGAVPQSFQIQQSVDWKAPWGAGLGGSGIAGDLLAVTTGNRLVAQIMTMQVWQGSGNDFEFTVQFELRAWSDPVRDVLEPLRSLLKMSLPSLGEGGFLKSPGPVLNAEGVKAVSGQFTKVVVDTGAAVASSFKTINASNEAVVTRAAAGAQVLSDAVKSAGLTSKAAIEQNMTNKISIQIGQWFSMDNIVVTQVQHDIKGQTPEKLTGVIQAASVTVSFKPMFSVTAEDVNSMLRAGSVLNDPRAATRGGR